jgi:hypothetical protein
MATARSSASKLVDTDRDDAEVGSMAEMPTPKVLHDSPYEQKLQVLNEAIQGIGFGKYHVRTGRLYLSQQYVVTHKCSK